MTATEFKAKCLQLMARVRETGEPLVVTKRGKPLVRVVAEREPKKTSIYGCMADAGLVVTPGDDLFSTGIVWDAER